MKSVVRSKLIALACWTACLLSLFSTPARSETTVYLRYGGPESVYKVTNASSASPIVVTAPGHRFHDGDLVYISMVRGNLAANGAHRVQGVNGTSFQLFDLEGNPRSGSGSYDGGGTVGQAQATTIGAGPHSLTDGPDGVLTARVKDPDGKGGSRAPAAQGIAYSALLRRYESRFKNPSLTEPSSGDSVLAAALGWYIDNSNTLFLNTARNWINNVERLVGYQSNSAFFGSCNEQVANCGSASLAFLDWGGFWAANWAMGYEFVRSELSDSERRTFAAKMLNGMNGEACENRLVRGPGSVTLTLGNNIVTGEGTNFLAIPSPSGRWFQVPGGKTYGTWVLIDNVVSDTELRLKSPAPVAAAGAPWWWENDWGAQSCGYFWWLSHHPYAPRVLTREGQTTLTSAAPADATEIHVANAAAFPQSVPFYVKVGSEWLKVVHIEQDVLTVERGQFATTPKTAAAKALATSTDFPPSGGMVSVSASAQYPLDSPQHNLTFSKIYSILIVALALLDDDPRAAPLFEATWNYWFDNVYPYSKSHWTGITQGGYAYGPPRWENWTYAIALIANTSFSPKIDLTSGNWLKDSLVYPIFGTLPWNSKRVVMYADSGTQDTAFSRWYRQLYVANYLYGDSPQFGYANYWLRKMTNWYSLAELSSPSGFNSIPYALVYTPPASGCPSSVAGELCTDPAEALDPHYFFANPDYRPKGQPDSAFNVVVSRQNWYPDSTLVWMQAIGLDTGDHLGSYPTPGSYRIARNQWLMAGGPYTLDAGALDRGNYVEVDGPAGIALPVNSAINVAGTPGVLASVDRQFGNRDYTFWRVNSSYAFKSKTAIARHYRNFLHLKAGRQDYLLVYDDVATTTPKSKLMRLHYYADDSEKGTFVRSQNAITYTRSQARISTQILLPTDPAKFSDSGTSLVSNRINISNVVVDDGVTEASEFLVVHRASNSTSDVMPSVRLLTTVGPGTVGVLIEDSELPRVALFSRNGSSGLTSISVTVPGLPRAAQMVATGLSPGTYELRRNGAVLTSDIHIATDGSFATDADSGATYELRQTMAQAPPLKFDAASTIPAAFNGRQYSHQLSVQDGVPPYTWSSLSGSLPAGLSMSAEGTIQGTPSEEGIFSFSVVVTDSSQIPESLELAFVLQVKPTPSDLLSIVTDALPDAVVGEYYSMQLEATGGVGTYRWVATSELPEGLTLSEDGLLSGTPVTEQSGLTLTVECSDQGSPASIAVSEFLLSVVPPEPSE